MTEMFKSNKTRKALWARPGFLVRRLHQIHMAIFLKECAEENVTPIQWGILTLVSAEPGIGHVEIAEELGLDRANVANVLNRLIKRKLLTQKDSTTDKRKKSISITSKGQQLLEDFKPRADHSQRMLLELLTSDERKVFMKLLTRLVQGNNELSRAPIRFDS